VNTSVAMNEPQTEAASGSVLEGVLGQAPAEPLPLDWVAQLAATHYGLQGEITLLAGERDRNHRLRAPRWTDAAAAGREGAGPGGDWVLKVSHPAESSVVADFQAQALLHLAATDAALPVQRVLPGLDGEPLQTVVDPSGVPRIVRVFSYLPGQPWPEAPHTLAQRLDLARQLAGIDRAFASFRHAAGALALPWDLQRAEEVRPLLARIGDNAADPRRQLATAALDRYAARALPHLPALRRQPIHNDLNVHNLLVDPADADRIAAVLDFGDMVEGPVLQDLAVACAYQLDATAEPAAMLADIAAFVAAYDSVNPLRDEEFELLFDLMLARLVMIVAISAWRAARQPENAPYLMRNNAVSWARLERAMALTPSQCRDALRAACGRSSSTATGAAA